MQIQIDNFFVPLDEYNGNAGLRINIDLSDGARRTSFSNELTFYGATKAYILDKLFFGANAQTEFISVMVFDECCKALDGSPLMVFTGKVTRADVSVSEEYGKADCGAVCTIIDDSQLGQKVQCVRNTIIHSTRTDSLARRVTDGENEFRDAPFFVYFEETRPRSYTYIVAYVLLFVLTLYFPLVAVLWLLSIGQIDLSIAYQFLIDTAFKARYHKAPYIHSYLTNVCRLCGLTLQSSLFEPTKPLHNMTRLDASFSEGGGTVGEARLIWNDFNRPNITGVQLLDSFRELNIGYTITETSLIVERKDVLQAAIWVDFITRGDADILELTYQTSDDSQPAGEIFSYAEDQSDKVGNEAVRPTSGAVVDYNTPFNPTLRGIRQTTMQYGATRFVGDGAYTGQQSVLAEIINGGYFNFVTFGQANVDTAAIISQTGVFATPRLIMHDGSSSTNRAFAENINGIINGRLWLRQDMLQTYNVPALYDLLLFINDPRRNLQKNLPFTLRFTYICEDLRSINTARQIRFNFFNQGAVVGEIKTIEVDFDNNEITVTGTI
jgi:hypothetical protein